MYSSTFIHTPKAKIAAPVACNNKSLLNFKDRLREVIYSPAHHPAKFTKILQYIKWLILNNFKDSQEPQY